MMKSTIRDDRTYDLNHPGQSYKQTTGIMTFFQTVWISNVDEPITAFDAEFESGSQIG